MLASGLLLLSNRHCQSASARRASAGIVAKLSEDHSARNNRIKTGQILNQDCVVRPCFESMLRATRPQIVSQQYLPGPDMCETPRVWCTRLHPTPHAELISAVLLTKPSFEIALLSGNNDITDYEHRWDEREDRQPAAKR